MVRPSGTASCGIATTSAWYADSSCRSLSPLRIVKSCKLWRSLPLVALYTSATRGFVLIAHYQLLQECKRFMFRTAFFVCAGVLLGRSSFPPPLYGQAVSIATVTGRVADQQGALVLGAEIRITNVDTGTIRDAVTNA